MKRIVQFLDLPPLNRTIMAAILEQSRINTKETMLYKEFGPMLPETVDMLNDFYEPFVDKFAEILNDEKFMWRDTDHL
nr:hypothetical protein BaRGS_026216 [Batillaria attramentaria]